MEADGGVDVVVTRETDTGSSNLVLIQGKSSAETPDLADLMAFF